MKKNIFKIISMIIVLGTLFSCDDYLDVQPEDKLLESQIYTTEGGINNILNGIYMDLVSSNLYGGNLTMSTIELLAQQYSVSDSRWSNNSFVTYQYEQSNVKYAFENVWSSAYIAILNINDLIANIDKYNTLPLSKTNIIKGEAYGLRAMVHFDLLRIFGPIYSVSPEASAIPYYTKVSTQNGEILSASDVMTLILEDLKKAEELLIDDSIKTGIIESSENTFYESKRNMRLNYFAVKALQARVNLYAGNTIEANNAAKIVIEQASDYFPWTEPSSIISAGANPDRVFSSELIFAIQNVNLYDRHDEYFASHIQDEYILAPNNTRLNDVFENNENDYRYNSTWILPTTGEKTYKTFYKYADVTDTNMSSRFLQPMVRISEMYYIAAETETDPNLAIEYLNTVRYNRGLVDLDVSVDLNTEIKKEYQKEFYGEGQLFFYYKRTNTSTIPLGSSEQDQTISMGENEYVVPLPDSETQYQ